MKTHTGKLTRRGWCRTILLQGCERGSGVYDMGGKGEKDTRTKKNKDKRGMKILVKDSGGGGDDNENMVLERREL